ncbi:MAG TPA: low affinity iron permease family protein, partial [Chitinophagaceae bacterium]|nr:low affinity iron permease family protein [Chitinophagaceae bacterium]
NKDTTAVQMKLNELIAATSTASNRLVDVEDLSDKELETIKKFYVALSALAKKEMDIHRTHSLDEAIITHQKKKQPETLKETNQDSKG